MLQYSRKELHLVKSAYQTDAALFGFGSRSSFVCAYSVAVGTYQLTFCDLFVDTFARCRCHQTDCVAFCEARKMVKVHCSKMKNATAIYTGLAFFETAYIFFNRLLILGEVLLHLLSSSRRVIYVGLVILGDAVSTLSVEFSPFRTERGVV